MSGGLIGGIVGGIVGFLLIVGGIVYAVRRRARLSKLAEETQRQQEKLTKTRLESSEIVLSIDTTDPSNETRSISSEASSIAVMENNNDKVKVKQSFLDRNLAMESGETSTTPYASKKGEQKLAANNVTPVSPTDGELNVQAGPVQPTSAANPEEGSDPHLWSVNETGRWCSSVLNIGPHVQRNVAVHKIDGPLLLKLTREDMTSHLQLTAQQASTLEDAIVQLFESQGSRALPQYAE
ncbi:hypothetical protein HDU81_002599 [Chytriomyces hyalinus]|nr:hypothetical protein HDU81_002599 [Chytriomyces hyalinus]